MLWGVCGGPDVGKAAKQAGYDYWEWSVPGALCPLESDENFKKAHEVAQSVGLPCITLNMFVPAQLRIVGSEVDFAALERYVETALLRAKIVGIKAIVFGSGGARKSHDDWPQEKAWDQLVRFSNMAGKKADDIGGSLIALEPLNTNETNTINSITEGAKLVKEINRKGFRLLIDSYHWEQEKPVPNPISVGEGLFIHAHTATFPKRLCPGLEDYSFSTFFSGLKYLGYDARISVEGRLTPLNGDDVDLISYLEKGLSFMKETWNKC